MHVQRWTDAISKVPGKDVRFYHLIMLLSWLRGKLHISHPWIISLPQRWRHLALSYVPLLQNNACVSAEDLDLTRVHRWVKVLCYIKNTLCSLFSVRWLLPSTHNSSNPFPECLAHILFHLSLWLIWNLPPLAPAFHWKTKTIAGYLIGFVLGGSQGN